MELGAAVRQGRAERAWTLQQLAEKTGLSVSYLSEIEQGKKRPSLKAARRLAEALGLPSNLIFAPQQAENAGPSLTLGTRLRLARESRSKTLEEAAVAAGISTSYLSQVERDIATPAIPTLKRLSETLGITPHQVIPEERDNMGAKLRTLRTNLNLSRAQVAERAGVSVSLVAQIENGRTQPSLETLQRLADVLGISPCYLIVENPGLEQMLTAMSPAVRDLLGREEVQQVMRMVCSFTQKEFTFLLQMIQLIKGSHFE